MPFSFLDIEERKSKVIVFLFIFLVAFYFVSAWLFVVVLRIFLFIETASEGYQVFKSFKSAVILSPLAFLIVFALAVIAGVIHWFHSTSRMIAKILQNVNAQVPDREDAYHRRFQNIVEEVGVATGGKQFEAVVLPTSAMNAFSIADFKGRAVIGVTEGTLSRLNRAQLEAVVAHEAAHIVTQDSLIKSVTVSLFGLYGLIAENLKKYMESTKGYAGGRSIRSKGSGMGYVIVIYVLTSIFHSLGKIINMFISRQCEYRADAVAVRLTRDPSSLAQALHLISKKWRGGGLGYEKLESLFIINPNYSKLDEKENIFSNLFSTHPPVLRRLDILLDMAHLDMETIEKQALAFKKPKRKEIILIRLKEPRWFIGGKNKWEGPFFVKELLTLGLLKHDSFLKREGSPKITLAYEDGELQKRISQFRKGLGGFHCPHCPKPLVKVLYEQVPVYVCEECKGLLMEQTKIPRILAREEQDFSQEVIKQAKAVEETAKKLFKGPKVKFKSELLCPKCNKLMLRNLYSLAYPIEVDRCTGCKYVWFDKDELEVFQYLVEKHRRV